MLAISLSDGEHKVTAAAPESIMAEDDLMQFSIVEVSMFKLKSVTSADGKEVNLVILKDKPTLIEKCDFQIGEPTHYKGDFSPQKQDMANLKEFLKNGDEEVKEDPFAKKKTPENLVVSVSDINTKTVMGWKVKVRVVKKSRIIAHKTGKLFKVDLVDADDNKTMIEGTFYTDSCDLFYDQIHEGRTYMLSEASISSANKRFTSI